MILNLEPFFQCLFKWFPVKPRWALGDMFILVFHPITVHSTQLICTIDDCQSNEVFFSSSFWWWTIFNIFTYMAIFKWYRQDHAVNKSTLQSDEFVHILHFKFWNEIFIQRCCQFGSKIFLTSICVRFIYQQMSVNYIHKMCSMRSHFYKCHHIYWSMWSVWICWHGI